MISGLQRQLQSSLLPNIHPPIRGTFKSQRNVKSHREITPSESSSSSKTEESSSGESTPTPKKRHKRQIPKKKIKPKKKPKIPQNKREKYLNPSFTCNTPAHPTLNNLLIPYLHPYSHPPITPSSDDSDPPESNQGLNQILKGPKDDSWKTYVELMELKKK